MTNKDQLFSIADDVVGTEILDNKMPSNLDFDDHKPAFQMTEITNKKQQSPAKQESTQQQFDIDNLYIKSYSLKGHTIFNLPPQFPIQSIAPTTVHSFPVKALNQEDFSQGFWGIWDNLKGYVNREMVIDQGYIYLFARQKTGLLCLNFWRLVDVFKLFVDLQQFQLRLVFKSQGSQTLITRDYQTAQLKNLLAKLNEQVNAIGLNLLG